MSFMLRRKKVFQLQGQKLSIISKQCIHDRSIHINQYSERFVHFPVSTGCLEKKNHELDDSRFDYQSLLPRCPYFRIAFKLCDSCPLLMHRYN